MLLGPLQLALHEVPGRDLGHLLGGDLQAGGEVVLARAEAEADHAGVGVLGDEAVDRVGHAALLADLLEEPGGGRAAENRVEQGGGEAAPVGAGDARRGDADVVLLGLLALEAKRWRQASSESGLRT